MFDSIANRSRVYDPLLEELRNSGIGTLDAGEAFAAAGTDTEPNSWFMEGGHYSPRGNAIVGLWVGKKLKLGCEVLTIDFFMAFNWKQPLLT